MSACDRNLSCKLQIANCKLREQSERQLQTLIVWLAWPYEPFRITAASRAALEKCVPPDWRMEIVWNEPDFLALLPTATHAIVWNFKKEWFALAPRLKLLATPGAGRELLPADAEMPPGVRRVNGTFHGKIMSETVLAFVLSHARGITAARDFQNAGLLWARTEMGPCCHPVAGTKAVIIGYGKIGKACGEKLQLLGVAVEGFNRANIAHLDSSLPDADWVILALPSDTGTNNLLDRRRIALLKPSAVVINVGRGNSIDEAALAEALAARRIAAAYLDVFAHEPLTSQSPLAANLPGLFRMPHASAFSPEYLPLFWLELQDNGFFS